MLTDDWAVFAGIDWATETHQVCVLGPDRQLLGQRAVPHRGPALSELIDWLIALAHGEPGRVVVAIEVPRGAVVEALLERGLTVWALNPKQLDRFRDRYSVAGAKDDRRDAWALAEAVLTDRAAFRRVQGDAPVLLQLRELSRVDEELGEELARLANRLREPRLRFYPQLLTFDRAARDPWVWALLELAPTPAVAARLSKPRLQRLLREHRIRRWTAETVHATLQEPPLRVAPGTVEAVSAHIALLLPRLRLVHTQRQECGRQLERLLAQWEETDEGPLGAHRDVTILQSLAGVGSRVAATMLAEASQPLRARDYHALRTQAGVAPVTRQSGRRRAGVRMRYACNRRLRTAVYHWARVSTQHDPRSRAHYAALRARGHHHARALRGVADRLLGLLVAMLKTRTVYDPDRRLVGAKLSA